MWQHCVWNEGGERESLKGKTIEPVEVQGRKIAASWWGQAWCHNLERLLQGEFPEELKELFTGSDGLFPAPKEISFSCNCHSIIVVNGGWKN